MPTVRRDVFQGISDPTRRNILSLIASRPMNLNGIADNFEMSRPAVSQHIKILTECGLVIIKQQGRERYCEPHLENLNKVVEWIEPFRQLWENRFKELDNLLHELQTKPKPKKK